MTDSYDVTRLSCFIEQIIGLIFFVRIFEFVILAILIQSRLQVLECLPFSCLFPTDMIFVACNKVLEFLGLWIDVIYQYCILYFLGFTTLTVLGTVVATLHIGANTTVSNFTISFAAPVAAPIAAAVL
jgi:hypothetical protein